MSDYRKLQVWRKAHTLALNAHRAATGIRGSQYAAFRSQIIRAALSKGHYLSLSTQVVEVRMMLHGLLRRLETGTKRPEPAPPKVPAS
jgi:hypothetical protein